LRPIVDQPQKKEETMTRETDSAEAVAYELFKHVCYAEGKDIGLMPKTPGTGERPNRRWIFTAYGECLKIVRSAKPSDSEGAFEARLDPSGHRYVSREAMLMSDPV
jgi:hypothetical protein